MAPILKRPAESNTTRRGLLQETFSDPSSSPGAIRSPRSLGNGDEGLEFGCHFMTDRCLEFFSFGGIKMSER
jgi:hypothetical protein